MLGLPSSQRREGHLLNFLMSAILRLYQGEAA
jgi:hypothetical protein